MGGSSRTSHNRLSDGIHNGRNPQTCITITVLASTVIIVIQVCITIV